ncbi:MAG: molybdenum cofactor guanylyltransferase [Dehalococcoidia bacterium]
MPRSAAIVLAGGRSRRMGRDKAAIVLAGRTLLQRAIDAVEGVVDEVVIVGAPGRALSPVVSTRPLRQVADAVEGEGPLAGLLAGLAATEAERCLVVGCDQPALVPPLLRLLLGRLDASRSATPLIDGRPQPLVSAVRADVRPDLDAVFARGERALRAVTQVEGADLVPEEAWRAADPYARSFVGVNTPEELARAEELLAAD